MNNAVGRLSVFHKAIASGNLMSFTNFVKFTGDFLKEERSVEWVSQLGTVLHFACDGDLFSQSPDIIQMFDPVITTTLQLLNQNQLTNGSTATACLLALSLSQKATSKQVDQLLECISAHEQHLTAEDLLKLFIASEYWTFKRSSLSSFSCELLELLSPSPSKTRHLANSRSSHLEEAAAEILADANQLFDSHLILLKHFPITLRNNSQRKVFVIETESDYVTSGDSEFRTARAKWKLDILKKNKFHPFVLPWSVTRHWTFPVDAEGTTLKWDALPEEIKEQRREAYKKYLS